MNHSSSVGTEGKFFEVDITLKEEKYVEELTYDILGERTNKSKKWWKKELKYEDKYFGKQEALDLGIITDDADDFGFDLNEE